MKKHFSNQQMLQDYAILFKNLKDQETLKKELSEYGYDDAEVSKGQALYDNAQKQYEQNIKEGQEETTAYADFSKKFDTLIQIYQKDRKKAKIIYKDQDEILKNLKIKGASSRRMANLLVELSVFYRTLTENENLRTPLQRLKITDEHIAAQIELLKQTQKAYAEYTKEKGENQDATKQKDAAFTELEKWVQELYSIAKIALEDRPQLLESIAQFVRS